MTKNIVLTSNFIVNLFLRSLDSSKNQTTQANCLNSSLLSCNIQTDKKNSSDPWWPAAVLLINATSKKSTKRTIFPARRRFHELSEAMTSGKT